MVEQTISYELLTQLTKSAVAQALERHRRLGESIAVWRDGKVVILEADQIPVQPARESDQPQILP